MRWVWRNGEIKFMIGENERNPEKIPPRLRFETHMKRPRRELGTLVMGGERLTVYATEPKSTPTAVNLVLGVIRTP